MMCRGIFSFHSRFGGAAGEAPQKYVCKEIWTQKHDEPSSLAEEEDKNDKILAKILPGFLTIDSAPYFVEKLEAQVSQPKVQLFGLQVKALRAALGPLSGRSMQYVTDSCISRYLRARSWNVKKAEKMLRETLAWRASYKPEDIRWDEVATESETGKVYRANFADKQGHTILVMHPAKQNTTSREGQIKQLVYSMENAISNLPAGQEQMMWLVDFRDWTLNKAISVKTVQETAYILQNHYPERLGIGILYNPPHYFEAFWLIVKPFLDPKTARKVKFVYSNDPTSMKPLSDLIDKEDVEAALRDENFNFEDYTDQMRLDDAKFALRRKVADEDSKSSMSAASTMIFSF